MAYCTYCGQELMKDARFCSKCGKAVSGSPVMRNSTVSDDTPHNCPLCGAPLDISTLSCPYCGYKGGDVGTSSAVDILCSKLEEIEASRPSSTKKSVAFLSSFWLMENIDKKKVSLIKNFPIPNSKHDLFELSILASSNIDMKIYGINGNTSSAAQREISDAWMSKLEQTYQKAKLLYSGTEEFSSIELLYKKTVKEIQKQKCGKVVCLISLMGLLFLMFFFLVFLGTHF